MSIERDVKNDTADSTGLWALYSDRVVLLDTVVSAYVVIDGEVIVGVQEHFAGEVVDCTGLVVMAGLVDSHVHINEPGRTEWEGFFTATQAAMAGGITTVIDMPLNCDPVTTTAEALDVKIQSLGDQLFVDIGFWGGVVPQELSNLEALLHAPTVEGCIYAEAPSPLSKPLHWILESHQSRNES